MKHPSDIQRQILREMLDGTRIIAKANVTEVGHDVATIRGHSVSDQTIQAMAPWLQKHEYWFRYMGANWPVRCEWELSEAGRIEAEKVRTGP